VLSNPDPVQFVVKFPGAGEALEAQPSSVGYHQYASSLGNKENELLEWAPFSTRLEWEVACWAKLRGPSSTALSELLRIDGVSGSIFIPSTLTVPFFSCRNRLGCHSQAQRNLTRSSISNSQMVFRNLFEKKLRSQGKHMSFIIAIYSNASKPSTATQNLHSV